MDKQRDFKSPQNSQIIRKRKEPIILHILCGYYLFVAYENMWTYLFSATFLGNCRLRFINLYYYFKRRLYFMVFHNNFFIHFAHFIWSEWVTMKKKKIMHKNVFKNVDKKCSTKYSKDKFYLMKNVILYTHSRLMPYDNCFHLPQNFQQKHK